MICVHCQTPLPEGSRYCLSCGIDLSDPGALASRTTVQSLQALSGMLAGHYRVVEKLGHGGMANVFLAEDLKLDRQVALKVLPPDLAVDDNLVGRFLREARTAAKLDHPHIIPIHEVHSEGELHYFAMKYVSGRTLEHALAEGPLSVEFCRQVLWEAATALAHAHANGVVHRDIKPSNILLDRGERVLLADFGIAKALESATRFTGTGQLVGTPDYMSPEQAAGLAVDGRSDQYSLAVVGFRALTGTVLFQAESSHAVLYMHVHEAPRAVRAVRPDVPADLATALERALAKQPDDRFATMDEFAAAVWPERGSGAAGGRRRAQRRGGRRAVAIAATAVFVLGAGGVLWLMKGTGDGRATDTRPAAVSPPAPSDSVTAAPPPVQTETPPATPPAQREVVAPPRETPRPPDRQPAAAAVGYLTIDAVPYATVSIDGVDIGDTPLLRHSVTPGGHEVRLTRQGYRTWTETINFTARNTERRRVQLIREEP